MKDTRKITLGLTEKELDALEGALSHLPAIHRKVCVARATKHIPRDSMFHDDAD